MENYSHSRLDILRKCFLNYKYKYEDKLPEVQDKTASDFGEVCHLISENYRGGGKPEILHHYRSLVPTKYKLNEYYTNKLPIAFKNISSIYNKYLKDDNILEIKRETDLNLNVVLTEEISINGKIDLFIKYKTGRIKIIDYKTNKAKRNNYTNQLSMYKLLIHKTFDVPYDMMDTDIVYLALDDKTKQGDIILNTGSENIIHPYDITDTDVYCLTEEIKELHNKIKISRDKKEWSSNPTWFNCTYCAFCDNCPKRY